MIIKATQVESIEALRFARARPDVIAVLVGQAFEKLAPALPGLLADDLSAFHLAEVEVRVTLREKPKPADNAERRP